MGELYRHVWNCLVFLGRRYVLWVGISVLAAGYAAAGTSPLDALPWVVIWAILAGASRVLLGILPRPAEGGGITAEAPPPAAQLAVGVVPASFTEACPDVQTMKGRLEPELRRLLGP